MKGMFGGKKRPSVTEGENTELTPLNDSKAAVDGTTGNRDFTVLSIFVIVDSEKEDVAKHEIEGAFGRFGKRVRKKLGDSVSQSELKIETDDKTIQDETKGKKKILKVTIPLRCLEFQAELDAVKVELSYKSLNDMIADQVKVADKEMAIRRAAEDPAYFPSTHLIFKPYSRNLKNYFAVNTLSNHPLSEIQQIWLSENIFDFDRMHGNGKIDSYFALHQDKIDEKIRFNSAFWYECVDYCYGNYNLDKTGLSPEALKDKKIPASTLKCKSDVFDQIRGYYGEQVGLYFRFVTHLAKWCIPLAVIGIACQAYVIYTMQVESVLIAVYAGMVVVWSNLVTEKWKRIEADAAYRWGMEGFESNEENRYQFDKNDGSSDAIPGFDFITGRPAKMVNWDRFTMKRTFSNIVVISLMACVCFTTITIYSIKSYLQVSFEKLGIPSQFSATCASFMNTAQIMIFKYLYSFISKWLNDFENHKTQTEYEDSMITKLTMFSFFNSYISFFYIAFIAGSVPVTNNDDLVVAGETQCGLTGCMGMLSENLFIVLITDLTSNKFCEYVLPLITVQEIWRVFTCNCYEKPKHESKLLGQFKREPYDFQGRLTDYTSLFVIFGYLVMFSPALPIASLLVAMSTAWESRGDLMKLFHMFRRVQPHSAEDIGAWQGAFETVTLVGIISNSGLIVFTMGMFSVYTFETQMWIFIGMQWFIYAALSVSSASVVDEPERVTVQRKRGEYYSDVLPPLIGKTSAFGF